MSTRPLPLADLNVTPFIDVLLVLLIVFMAVVPPARHGLVLELPAAAAPQDRAPHVRVPVIRVERAGLTLDAQPLASLGELDARLRERFAGGPSRRVCAQAQGALRYGAIVRVLDVARGAGAQQLALLPALPEPPH